MTDANGRQVSLLGSSIGGGNILVTEVNGMEVSLTGQYTTLIVLHKDAPAPLPLLQKSWQKKASTSAISVFPDRKRRRGGYDH